MIRSYLYAIVKINIYFVFQITFFADKESLGIYIIKEIKLVLVGV